MKSKFKMIQIKSKHNKHFIIKIIVL
jgi:hypothetical protein